MFGLACLVISVTLFLGTIRFGDDILEFLHIKL